MAAPAALLAGPLIRLVVIVGLAAFVFLYADFGGLVDTIVFEIEQFIQNTLNPF